MTHLKNYESVLCLMMGTVGQVLGLVKTFNIAIFLLTLNATNVKLKLCKTVELIELYPFVPLSVSDLDCISRSQLHQTVVKIGSCIFGKFLSSPIQTS